MTDPIFFVSDGISSGKTWATYRRRKSGALRRVKSPALPQRDTKEEAEQDLARWLQKRQAEKARGSLRRGARELVMGGFGESDHKEQEQ